MTDYNFFFSWFIGYEEDLEPEASEHENDHVHSGPPSPPHASGGYPPVAGPLPPMASGGSSGFMQHNNQSNYSFSNDHPSGPPLPDMGPSTYVTMPPHPPESTGPYSVPPRPDAAYMTYRLPPESGAVVKMPDMPETPVDGPSDAFLPAPQQPGPPSMGMPPIPPAGDQVSGKSRYQHMAGGSLPIRGGRPPGSSKKSSSRDQGAFCDT